MAFFIPVLAAIGGGSAMAGAAVAAVAQAGGIRTATGTKAGLLTKTNSSPPNATGPC